MLSLAPATADHAIAIDHLLDRCFGPARRARTAYRLRDGVDPLRGYSLVAHDGAMLLGSVQLWPLLLCGPGTPLPLTLLGPLAVAPERRSEGVGAALLTAALARVDAAGAPPIVLIGDLGYYARFGFNAAPTQGWRLPGPVDRARLLVRRGAGLPEQGRLAAALPALRIAA